MTPDIAVALATVAADVSKNQPVPMEVVGWNKSAVGIWAGLIMAIIYGLPKFVTAMRKLSYDRGDQLDDERRGDMAAMRIEIAEIKVEIREATRRANIAEVRLSAAMVIIRLLSAKVREKWPDDPLLKDVDALLDDISGEHIPNEMLSMISRIRRDGH